MKIRSQLPHRSVSLIRCTSALRNECTELTFLPLSTSFLCIIPRFWQQFTRTTGYGSIGNSSGKPGYKSRQFCVTLSWFVNKNVSRSPFSENQCFIFTQLFSVICDTIRHVLYTGGKTLVLSFRQKNNQADIIHQKKVIARRRELRRNWESRNSRLLPRLNVMASFQRWLHFPTSNTQESRI